jgi:hypothetical protein
VTRSKHTNSASTDETEEKQQSSAEQESEGEKNPSYWVD